MKLHEDITINGKPRPRGSNLPWYAVYPFFLIHMAGFGGSGFLMAYSDNPPPLLFMYAHGGLAIFVYTIFYRAIFGREEVKWMFINGLLGLFGIYVQIGWILGLFDKNIADFPWYRHITPFLYYILYTFLLWQAVLEISGAAKDENRRARTEKGYVVVSLLVYLGIWFLERR